MKFTIMKPVFQFLFLSFVFVSGILKGQNPVQQAIDALKKDPEMEHAAISFLVTDAGNGDRIAELNPSASLPTASTTKLFSTAVALEILGSEYRPSTRIYLFGVLKDGILNGDLVIRGGGDVSLGSRYFNEQGKEDSFLKTWCDTLKSLGVQQITGDIIADGSAFGYEGVPEGWAWADIGNYYGAPPSGISVYDNTLRFYFRTGGKPGSAAELIGKWPEIPQLKFTNGIKAADVTGDNSYITGGPYAFERSASGSLPLNAARFEVKGSHPDPEWQLAYDLKRNLIREGVQIQGDAFGIRTKPNNVPNYETQGRLVYTHYGKSIQEIANLTNLKSVNLFAEGLLCLVGYHLTGRGTTTEGIIQLEEHLNTRFSLHGLVIKDGSGLSRNNGISAAHFIQLLKTMYQSPQFESYYKTLPVAGKSGTIASLCKGGSGEGRIHAKSGSMSKIRSYAGYVQSKSGKTLLFSITLNNFTCSGSAAAKKIENVLNAIAAY